MSPAAPMAAAVFINPPPHLNSLLSFTNTRRKTFISGPTFRTSKESAIVSWKSVKQKKTMAAGSIESPAVGGGSGDEFVNIAASAFEQEAFIDGGGVSPNQTVGVLHRVLNRLSKWLVAVTFGGVILLRHDALALWASMGSVLNVILSITLKKILNQERPVSEVSSGPGMPSSHAQSIFFAVVFVTLSLVQWLGLNGFSAIMSGLVIALGSYFSWLRVSLRYHTTSQVVVGAVVGSIFSLLWFWTWDAIVLKAYNSYLWVQILVIIGAACFCVGFIFHILRYWTKDD